VLTVTNSKQAGTFARFNAFSLVRGRWIHRWGPWTARIGAGGFANPGQKIEGHALTPQGSYGFQFMFGVKANPGAHFHWRHAYRYDYWDDDPHSARYNLWTDTRHYHAGVNPEPMHNVPAYNYAAVIGYNLARVPGAGSAIFLHVGDGQATGGCVSLPQARLLKIIRWLRPQRVPVITMHVLK
jgi:L,D-peptidoglycan transpeptidase YkuD (ErfK/YbiS/YcfS/YnhG family)